MVGDEISSETLLIEDVCIKIMYFPFYPLVFVGGFGLTSINNFEVRHPIELSCNYHVNKQQHS
jgi:hypothetical protein